MPAISQSFRCFDEVARRGSVRKAAESLHLTPAAVNQQVLNLEAQLGTPLFDRLARGMQLTSAGEIIIAAVRRSQRDYDNALTQVEDLRTLRRGHVNLGASHASAEHVMPAVIERVTDSHPGLTFGVRSGTGDALLRWVAQGEVDVAYCLRRQPPPGVVEVRAWPQHLGVVTPPDHPLALRRGPLRLRDCLDQPLILVSPDTELRAMADRIEVRLQRQVRPLVETGSVPMVRRLVARGKGVGFLLPDNVSREVDAGVLAWTGLADAGAHSHSCLYQRAGYTTAVAMGTFLETLESEVAAIRGAFEAREAARLAP